MTVFMTSNGSVSVQLEDVATYRGLTPQQHRERFEDRGYTVLTDLFDDDLIAEWRNAIKKGRQLSWYHINYKKEERGDFTTSLSKTHKNLATLAEPILGRSLPEKYQQGVQVFNNVVDGSPLHYDGAMGIGQVMVGRIWVPLTGYDQDASWLSLVPGSHLRKLEPSDVTSLALVERNLSQNGLVSPVDLEGRTGYGILFRPDVAHGSSHGQIGHERTSLAFEMIATSP